MHVNTHFHHTLSSIEVKFPNAGEGCAGESRATARNGANCTPYRFIGKRGSFNHGRHVKVRRDEDVVQSSGKRVSTGEGVVGVLGLASRTCFSAGLAVPTP